MKRQNGHDVHAALVSNGIVRAWNAAYPVGYVVTVVDDAGLPFDTETSSEAWVREDGTPMVSVVDRAGGYELARVVPVRPPSGIARPTYGVRRIQAERQRHDGLGFNKAHDDQHRTGGLAIAAACLLLEGLEGSPTVVYRREPEFDAWPFLDWDPREGKTIEDRLAIAGSLTAAEIDRHRRAEVHAFRADLGQLDS